jgi:hypothetical protein
MMASGKVLAVGTRSYTEGMIMQEIRHASYDR